MPTLNYGLLSPTTPIRRGAPLRPRWSPAVGGPPGSGPPPPPVIDWGLLAPITAVRRGAASLWPRWTVAVAGPSTYTPLCWRPVAGRHPVRRGRAWMGSGLNQPVVLPSVRPASRAQVRRRGNAWMGAGLAHLSVVLPVQRVSRAQAKRSGRAWMGSGLIQPLVALPVKSVSRAQAKRAGRVWFPSCPLVANHKTPLSSERPIVRTNEDRLRRRCGSVNSSPVWQGVVSTGDIYYHVYCNSGYGPINYSLPIATVQGGLTWTSGPLSYPAVWQFGVRAFWSGNLQEEQNLEAAVTIALSAAGTDISNAPSAPIGMRAFATAGGGIRVEWGYAGALGPKVPTGFNVYLPTQTGPLAPTTVSRRRSKAQRWSAGIGGGWVYPAPVATVPFASSIMNSWVANIGPFPNGTVLTVAVRSYNSVAIEQNGNVVTVTAVGTGPTAVSGLTATATA